MIKNDTLKVLIAAGGAVMALMCASGANAKSRHHHGHKATAAATNVHKITTPQLPCGPISYNDYTAGKHLSSGCTAAKPTTAAAKPVTSYAKPARIMQASTTVTQPVAVVEEKFVSPYAGYTQQPEPKYVPPANLPMLETGGITILSKGFMVLDPRENPLNAYKPTRLNNMGLTSVALSIVEKKSDVTSEKVLNLLENMTIARIEAGADFKPDVVVSEALFTSREGKIQRPAGPFQFKETTFVPSLSPMLTPALWNNLTPEQQRVTGYGFDLVYNIASDYAVKHKTTPEEVMQSPKTMTEAYKSASPARRQVMRGMRTSNVAMPGDNGTQTTVGLFFSSLALRGLQIQSPEPVKDCYKKYVKLACYYANHNQGEGNLAKMSKNKSGNMIRSCRNNKSVVYDCTVTGMLSGLSRNQFKPNQSMLDVVAGWFAPADETKGVADATPNATSPVSAPTRNYMTVSYNTTQSYPYKILYNGPSL